MLKNLILGTLLFTLISVHAQQANQFNSDRGMMIFTKEKEPDAFTGSPYYEDDFILGVIHDDQGRSLNVMLRYNALEDVVVIKPNTSQQEDEFMLPKLKTITYELDDYTYFIDNLKTDNGNIEAYFAKFYEGKKSLFIGQPKVDLTPPQKAKTGYEKDKPANINVKMVYYLSIDGGMLMETRLKEKDLKDFFKSDKMKDYFNSKKINTENDVIELLKYYENNG